MKSIVETYREKFIAQKQRRRRLLSILLLLALVVTGGVFWQLRDIGIALTNEVNCGYEEHVHTNECYSGNQQICVLEEHSHTISCLSDSAADVEVAEDWESTLPELSGNLAQDVVAIAQGQLGYAESEDNFTVADDGETRRGYTRYGAWYGNAYGDWESLFAAFCLSYAGVDGEMTQHASGAYAWSVALSQLGVWVDAEETEGISVGGLIFFDADLDGKADGVGIITAAEKFDAESGVITEAADANTATTSQACAAASTQETAAGSTETTADEEIPLLQLTVIRGDWDDTVAELTYYTNDETILGYVLIPEEDESLQDTAEAAENTAEATAEDTTEATAETSKSAEATAETGESAADAAEATALDEDTSLYSVAIYTDDTYTATAESAVDIYVSGDLPRDASLVAYPVEVELEGAKVICAYDITILLADGSVYEPEESLTVQFVAPALCADGVVNQVYYVPEEGEPEAMTVCTTEEGVAFVAEHFSTYTWVQNNATSVSTAEALMAAVNAATASQETYIQLTDSFTIDSDTQSMTLTARQDIIIDLNGKTLTVDGSGSLFTVNSNVTLTIIDTATSQGQNTGVTRDGGTAVEAADAGKLAEMTVSEGKVTLTYYVTESTVTDSSTGTTAETRYAYTVTSSGMISCSGSCTVFIVTGGTLNVGSGFFYGGNPDGKDSIYARLLQQSAGTVELTGGYICGFVQKSDHDTNYYGGAVCVTGGALTLSDAVVLAGNRAPTGGAIALFSSATLNITGGVISGNEATLSASTSETRKDYGGGGIFAKASTVNISGGYLTNNKADSTGYFNGGGGILLQQSTLNFSGGYITGNYAESSGGGIRTTFQESDNVVNITGGYICANYAATAEGGGVCIDNLGVCTVIASSGASIYINNNATGTTEHWGGGGLFVANGGTMTIQSALITENTAGGFGGGVAGCSTGRIAVSVEGGVAIFDNSAAGTNTSGSSSEKSDDWEFALKNEVFMTYGYADYYCALSSSVVGAMLGGGSENWTGSVDGSAVTGVGIGEVLEASSIMGLTSEATQEDKEKAMACASVYITGNSSNTHGGGVLSNGYLLLGEVDSFVVGSSLQLEAEKVLLDATTNAELEVAAGEFSFEVLDELGAVVALGTTEEDGSIFFDRRLTFSAAGTYVFTIRETESQDASIVTDTAYYLLTVTVTEVQGSTITVNGKSISHIYYQITHIKLEKVSGSTTVTCSDMDVSSSESSTYHYSLESPTFTNYRAEKIAITVNKEWEGESTITTPITVTLYQTAYTYDAEDNLLSTETNTYSTITLSADNSWTYTWSELVVLEEKEIDGSTVTLRYSYEAQEEIPESYVASYTKTTEESVTYYWVPATELVEGGQYLIVSNDNAWALKLTTSNTQLTEEDKASINVSSGSLTVNGSTYTEWVEDSQVLSSMIWIATTNNHDGTTRLLLKNRSISTDSLLAQGGSGIYTGLKGCDSDYYGSSVKLEDGYLQIQKEWTASNDWNYLVYADGRFNSIPLTTSGATDSAVKVYTRVAETAAITTTTTVTITNTAVTEATYTINLTKLDATDNNFKLSGAVFQLLDSDGKIVLVTGGSGSYTATGQVISAETLSTVAETTEATTEMTTVSTGKLVITGLSAGTYTLREVTAPDGYTAVADMVITLGTGDSTTYTLTVEDSRTSYLLPMTGGVGTYRFTLIGLLLSSTAAYLLYKKKRQRKEVLEK